MATLLRGRVLARVLASAFARVPAHLPDRRPKPARLALQKVGDERSELLAALDLSPMAATSEHVQSRVIDQIEQTKRGLPEGSPDRRAREQAAWVSSIFLT